MLYFTIPLTDVPDPNDDSTWSLENLRVTRGTIQPLENGRIYITSGMQLSPFSEPFEPVGDDPEPEPISLFLQSAGYIDTPTHGDTPQSVYTPSEYRASDGGSVQTVVTFYVNGNVVSPTYILSEGEGLTALEEVTYKTADPRSRTLGPVTVLPVPDTDAPIISGLTYNPTRTDVRFTFSVNEAASYYVVLSEQGVTVSDSDLFAAQSAIGSTMGSTPQGQVTTQAIGALSVDTVYSAHIGVSDPSGNRSRRTMTIRTDPPAITSNGTKVLDLPASLADTQFDVSTEFNDGKPPINYSVVSNNSTSRVSFSGRYVQLNGDDDYTATIVIRGTDANGDTAELTVEIAVAEEILTEGVTSNGNAYLETSQSQASRAASSLFHICFRIPDENRSDDQRIWSMPGFFNKIALKPDNRIEVRVANEDNNNAGLWLYRIDGGASNGDRVHVLLGNSKFLDNLNQIAIKVEDGNWQTRNQDWVGGDIYTDDGFAIGAHTNGNQIFSGDIFRVARWINMPNGGPPDVFDPDVQAWFANDDGSLVDPSTSRNGVADGQDKTPLFDFNHTHLAADWNNGVHDGSLSNLTLKEDGEFTDVPLEQVEFIPTLTATHTIGTTYIDSSVSSDTTGSLGFRFVEPGTAFTNSEVLSSNKTVITAGTPLDISGLGLTPDTSYELQVAVDDGNGNAGRLTKFFFTEAEETGTDDGDGTGGGNDGETTIPTTNNSFQIEAGTATVSVANGIYAGTYTFDTADAANGPVNLVEFSSTQANNIGDVVSITRGLWASILPDGQPEKPMLQGQFFRGGQVITGEKGPDYTVIEGDEALEVEYAENATDSSGSSEIRKAIFPPNPFVEKRRQPSGNVMLQGGNVTNSPGRNMLFFSSFTLPDPGIIGYDPTIFALRDNFEFAFRSSGDLSYEFTGADLNDAHLRWRTVGSPGERINLAVSFDTEIGNIRIVYHRGGTWHVWQENLTLGLIEAGVPSNVANVSVFGDTSGQNTLPTGLWRSVMWVNLRDRNGVNMPVPNIIEPAVQRNFVKPDGTLMNPGASTYYYGQPRFDFNSLHDWNAGKHGGTMGDFDVIGNGSFEDA